MFILKLSVGVEELSNLPLGFKVILLTILHVPRLAIRKLMKSNLLIQLSCRHNLIILSYHINNLSFSNRHFILIDSLT